MSKTVDAEVELIKRCRAILIQHKKPLDCTHMGRLLKEDSSACYRAMLKIDSVIVISTQRGLTKFAVRCD